uniref:Peptidase M11 gametolysin domain-containing protein n=1 Tax=Ditylum brightwellii TaxID=49249 RepID=A0A7S4VLA9_9STRA
MISSTSHFQDRLTMSCIYLKAVMLIVAGQLMQLLTDGSLYIKVSTMLRLECKCTSWVRLFLFHLDINILFRIVNVSLHTYTKPRITDHNCHKFVINIPSHTLGHNFGFGHSGGLDGQAYSDHTGMMGNPLFEDEVGKMCFNAAKNWQISWYGGVGEGDEPNPYKVKVDPQTNRSSSFELVGIGEFDKNNDQHPVVVKIETGTDKDYFVAFNRAVGPNAENVEADNEITVVQVEGGNGLSYAQSYLKAHLLAGESYTEDNFANTGEPFSIKAKYIDISSEPATASIDIIFGADLLYCTSDADCLDDNIYCNGVETCDMGTPGVCVSSGDPCQLGSKCIEESQSCTSCDEVTVHLTTDNYAGETSWDIKKDSDGTTIGSGSGFSIGYHTATFSNLQEGTYTFTIYDAWGDGICCCCGDGSYEVTLCGNTLVQGSSFGQSESTQFTIESGSTSLPTTNPTQKPTSTPTKQPTNTPTKQPTNTAH